MPSKARRTSCAENSSESDRAFSSGCSALTGVEAVSNGVPAFRKPKVRNAQTTLVLMGSIAIIMFAGLTLLALVAGVHYAENPCNLIGFDCKAAVQPSLMAQVAAATFGNGSILFFVIQAATAAVLLLAANTAFNGFPLLGSVLARDGFVGLEWEGGGQGDAGGPPAGG